jgi:endoribonuclease Nob1
MKKQIFILDTSAILSGKPLYGACDVMMTVPGVSAELKPGGRDYRTFELLQETGLSIHAPSLEALSLIKQAALKTGDSQRLSSADLEVLALAVDVNKEKDTEAVILTDDYSIQNVAVSLHILFVGVSQKEIKKKFKWVFRCPACKKQCADGTTICPICGSALRSPSQKKKNR